MKRHRVALWFLLAGVLSAGAQTAAIRVKKVPFPTYNYSDPDPVAQMNLIYPYFRFDGYSAKAEEKLWTVVEMENEYIRVLVCPDQGGKILGAFEKSTGRDFIYFNKVVKFRDVAMRGPWTSGGIELNFGAIGHAPTTASPVDHTTRKNKDGSVSCFVGATDWASRTAWQVEIVLPADRAWFETRSIWSNSTPFRTSRYHWMNGAVEAKTNLRYLYPGSAYIGHGGQASPWPVDGQGRDLSLYGSNDFGSYKSYHVLGQHTDFFGGVYEGEGFGFGHLSDYGSKPGKKIWIWGLSRQGMIWEDLLTDTELGNRQYSEIQSGLLFNQAGGHSSETPFKHRFLNAGEAVAFNEKWFPLRGVEGVHAANDQGVLEVQQQDDQLVVRFMALAPVQEVMQIRSGSRVLSETAVSLKPLEIFADSVSIDKGVPVDIVCPKSGLRWQSPLPNEKLSRPLTSPDNFDEHSAYAFYLKGAELARQRNWAGAAVWLDSCLTLSPHYVPALSLKAEYWLKSLQPQKAFELVRQGLAVDTYDAQCNWIYGLAARRLGKRADALDGFGIAGQWPEIRQAAWAQLAEMAAEQRDWHGVRILAERMLNDGPCTVQALQLKAVALRHLGEFKALKAVLEQLDSAFQLSPVPLIERYLQKQAGQTAKALQNSIGGEMPAESFMEAAMPYVHMGLYAEAESVLNLAPDHPMVQLWRAWLAYELGRDEESTILCKTAQMASPRLVFPHRQESLPVLQWAVEQHDHWTFRYYLGLLYWRHHQTEKAKAMFDSCQSRPEYAPFYLSRARLNEAVTAGSGLDDLKRALTLAPESWRVHAALLDHHISRNDDRDAEAAAWTALRKFPGDYRVLMRCAKAMMMAGRYTKVMDILSNLTILPYEGAQDGRRLYREAHVLSAVRRFREGKVDLCRALVSSARRYPERLGVGRPYDPDERVEDYLTGLFLRRLGSADKAEAMWKQVIAYTDAHGKTDHSDIFLKAMAMKELGREAEGLNLLLDLEKAFPGHPFVVWAITYYRGKTEEWSFKMTDDKSGRSAPWEMRGAGSEADFIRRVFDGLRAKEPEQ